MIMARRRWYRRSDAVARWNAPRTVALLVDQSMSMSYKSGEDTRLSARSDRRRR
jgi:hypothetical protein